MKKTKNPSRASRRSEPHGSAFRVGQRVQMTSEAIQQRLAPWGRTGGCLGTVTAVHPPLGVSVRRDGTKMARRYHVVFWTPNIELCVNDDMRHNFEAKKEEVH